jgi:hypothetical protein
LEASFKKGINSYFILSPYSFTTRISPALYNFFD